MIYLFGLLSLYDFISTWTIITCFGTGDANPIANFALAYDGGWAFLLALKIFEILGIFAIVKLWTNYYDKKHTNYIMAVLSGMMLGVGIWNTYVFISLYVWALG